MFVGARRMGQDTLLSPCSLCMLSGCRIPPVGVEIFISDKIDFKINVTRDKEGH